MNGVEIQTVNRDTICRCITEDQPADVNTWKREDNVIHSVLHKPANMLCPDNKPIVNVDFASYLIQLPLWKFQCRKL